MGVLPTQRLAGVFHDLMDLLNIKRVLNGDYRTHNSTHTFYFTLLMRPNEDYLTFKYVALLAIILRLINDINFYSAFDSFYWSTFYPIFLCTKEWVFIVGFNNQLYWLTIFLKHSRLPNQNLHCWDIFIMVTPRRLELRLPAWKACFLIQLEDSAIMEWVKGIEPSSYAWKA